MSQFDLKITNGTVANSAETFQADIGVKDGKIITIGKKLGNADRVVGKIITMTLAANMSCPEA